MYIVGKSMCFLDATVRNEPAHSFIDSFLMKSNCISRKKGHGEPGLGQWNKVQIMRRKDQLSLGENVESILRSNDSAGPKSLSESVRLPEDSPIIDAWWRPFLGPFLI